MDYHIRYLSIFQKSVHIIQLLLKSDKNNEYVRQYVCIFMIISRLIVIQIINFQKRFAENIKTHILSSVTFFRNLCDVWDLKKYGRDRLSTDDNTIRRMRFECWITQTTHPHNTYSFSTAKIVMPTTLSVTLYVHYSSCRDWFLISVQLAVQR